MSRRNFPRVLAAGLLAVASPALAQSPNPWRTPPVEVAPAPRPASTWGVPAGSGLRIPVAPLGGKPSPPPEVRGEMLNELVRLGAQLDVPAWTPPPPSAFDADTVEQLSQLLGGVANALTPLFRLTGGFQTYERGTTLPSPQYLQHYPQSFPAEPAFPLQREQAAMQAPPLPAAAPARAAGSAPLGLWHRKVGTMTYSVVVRETHLLITTKMTVDVGGKAVTHGVVLTCDYHVTRDGSNLVGLVTGVDAVCEGVGTEPPADELPKVVAKLQKAMTDKPFAVSFRVYDNALVIGNVRLPACDDKDLGVALESAGGRYQPVSEFANPMPPKATPTSPPPVVPVGGISSMGRRKW